MTNTTSRTDRTTSDSNYIKIHANQGSSARSIRSSKLVVTIEQIKRRYNNKTLENWNYSEKSMISETSRNDRKITVAAKEEGKQ